MDLSGLPILPLAGYSAGWLLVVGVVVAFFRGRIWTDAAYQEKAHEANEWRTESRIKDQQILEKDIQLRHVEEVGRNVLSIMSSIQRNARSGDRNSHQEEV
jgi:vacuolar-type H+-ATPase subunit D/Vma8